MLGDAPNPVSAKPAPAADGITAFYWHGAEQQQLLVLRCAACTLLSHPPDAACPWCGALELTPEPVSGHGSVYSFTIVRQAFDVSFANDVPYVIALVELDEQAGLVVLANLIDVPLDEIEIGARVEVTFEDRGDHTLPQFRLADSAPVSQ